MHVVKVAVELIVFASIGLVALVLLATSTTTGLSPTVAFLAVVFVSLMAVIGVAVSFIPSSIMSGGLSYDTTPSSQTSQQAKSSQSAPIPQLVVVGAS